MPRTFPYQYEVLTPDSLAVDGRYRVIATSQVMAEDSRGAFRKALATAMLAHGKNIEVRILDDRGRRQQPPQDCHGELDDFRDTIALLCPTREAAAGVLGLKYDTLMQYLNGRRIVPADVKAVLADVMRDHGQHLLDAAADLESANGDGA